ncbi:prepilin-type N-terminal cleavage/methylation domain-containing protein [Dyella humi]|uniref:Prepilin-type N-terminal cleavage/methylation domain-containing protein n=2 Tax=Dyella humi TaxID=1770547 RepID=A0ABW8IG69_9GAMM
MPQTAIRPAQQLRTNGFTLIELMIVVVILAILAAIAIPIYQKYVMESRRTAAKSALFDLASREEKYYSTTNQYTNSLSTLGYSSGGGGSITVPNGVAATDYYKITVQLTGNPTASTNFTATAQATNSQASDSCGNFTLTDLGVQGNSGSQTTGCW